MDIDIVEIMSGEEDVCFWVSIGFSSALEPNDVLHIVCSKKIDEQDRKHEMDTIYLERFDQAYSCYNGVNSMSVSNENIIIEFNKKGCQFIDIDQRVIFVNKTSGSQYTKAYKYFQKISKLDCGRVVNIL